MKRPSPSRSIVHSTGRAVLAVLLPVLTALTVLVFPGQASAAVGDFVCTVSTQTTYSPGLILEPRLQHITFNVGYSNCLSLSQPSIISGTRINVTDRVHGCLDLPTGGTTTVTTTWNTGQTSTFAGTRAVEFIGGQTIFTWRGTITAGLFSGSGFTEVISHNSLNLLACLIPPGITSQSGTGTLISS